jgi:hypothetical protein
MKIPGEVRLDTYIPIIQLELESDTWYRNYDLSESGRLRNHYARLPETSFKRLRRGMQHRFGVLIPQVLSEALVQESLQTQNCLQATDNRTNNGESKIDPRVGPDGQR